MADLPFFSLQTLGLATSSSTLLADWLQQMQTQFPGYSPSSGSLEYVLAQIFATWASDVATLCSSGGDDLFQAFGTSLVGVPAENGSPALAVVSIAANPLVTPIAQLSAPLSTGGGAITSLPVTSLAYQVLAGTVTIDDGAGHSQAWSTSGATAGGTAIPVSSQTPSFNFVATTPLYGTTDYTLPAGSQILLSQSGVQLGFLTSTDLTIASGQSTATTVAAVQPGSEFNGAGGPAQMNSQVGWVESVTVIASATDGTDAEDSAAYLNRLAKTLQLMAPRPITANDFATMALSFAPIPGTDQQLVGRATAIDGYNPGDLTYNNERMVALCVTDDDGDQLSDDTMYGIGGSSSTVVVDPSARGVAGWLMSLRELNFLVNVVPPNYNAVWVSAEVKATTGFSLATVQATVQANLLAYLSPATFGLPLQGGIGWQNLTFVYRSRVMSVVQGTSGVDHVVSLGMGIGSPSNTTGDVALTGAFPLPRSTTTTIPLSAITVDP